MCDYALIRPASGEDDPIGTGTAPSIRLVGVQDWEFVVRSRIRKGETLVVFVLMGILITTHGLPILVVAVPLLYSCVDVGLVVAC